MSAGPMNADDHARALVTCTVVAWAPALVVAGTADTIKATFVALATGHAVASLARAWYGRPS